LDSPLAGKTRHARLNAEDADTSGDIGLFDVATEDEAASTEYSSAEEDVAEQESQGLATDSEPAEDESDNSEWTPDSPEGSAKGNEHVNLKDLSLELTAVKKTTLGSTMVDDLPSPLQYKSSTKTPRPGKLGVIERRISFENLFEESGADNADDSTIIIPNKQTRKAALTHAGPDAEYIPRPAEVDDIPKKKKR
jgi:hypothetical protein